MALIELNILSTFDLFKDKNIQIPNYQRPYSWGVESVSILFDDIYQSFKNDVLEYRLGTVILHKNTEDNVNYQDSKDIYSIVDGQQRLTTISIILYYLDKVLDCKDNLSNYLQNSKYGKLSINAILKNYELIKKLINNLTNNDRKSFKDYILNKCTFVQIVTNDEQEAFQFFDSQNSRGKELEPHDLLKSYHLREMSNLDINFKVKLINEWESCKQEDLAYLFSNYLYPITQWYRGRNGLNYSSKKIGHFKGISSNNTFNYASYHKASNLFVEQFNKSNNSELLGVSRLNQFQLNQPILAGFRFFEYSLHYKKLLEDIRFKIKSKLEEKLIPAERSGDIYTKRLFECTLIFFVDRFGINALTDNIFYILYSWCYYIRLRMHSVYVETINKYALGLHDNSIEGIGNIFSYINDSISPNKINMLVIPKLKKEDLKGNNKNKYQDIYDKLNKINNWGE